MGTFFGEYGQARTDFRMLCRHLPRLLRYHIHICLRKAISSLITPAQTKRWKPVMEEGIRFERMIRLFRTYFGFQDRCNNPDSANLP